MALTTYLLLATCYRYAHIPEEEIPLSECLKVSRGIWARYREIYGDGEIDISLAQTLTPQTEPDPNPNPNPNPSPSPSPTLDRKDTVERTLPYWRKTIAPALKRGKTVLIAAHGNSIRGALSYP